MAEVDVDQQQQQQDPMFNSIKNLFFGEEDETEAAHAAALAVSQGSPKKSSRQSLSVSDDGADEEEKVYQASSRGAGSPARAQYSVTPTKPSDTVVSSYKTSTEHVEKRVLKAPPQSPMSAMVRKTHTHIEKVTVVPKAELTNNPIASASRHVKSHAYYSDQNHQHVLDAEDDDGRPLDEETQRKVYGGPYVTTSVGDHKHHKVTVDYHEQVRVEDADDELVTMTTEEDVVVTEEQDEMDLEEEFDPFIFIKRLAKPCPDEFRLRPSPIPAKNPNAPPVTLVLDLDETLVHCSVSPIPKPDLKFIVTFNGVDYQVYARRRPHLKLFLETVSKWFEVIVFTASQSVYADKVLDILDPDHSLVQHRLFRESCVNLDGTFLKDLHIVGRDMSKMAIIDNSPQAFGYQVNNGIPIESWFDDEADEELLHMLPFLERLKDAQDVRPLIRDKFRLEEFIRGL